MKTKSLTKLSDKELLSRVEKLGIRERETMLEVLLYLREIEKRELYLREGYRSLYDFCIRHLRYSESSALRRIRTARCIRDYPEVSDMLLGGEVNLDTISRVSKVLSRRNRDALLREIRGKSSREVEVIVSRYSPKPSPRDRVRPIYVMAEAVESARKFTAGAGGKKASTFSNVQGDNQIGERSQRTWMDVLEQDKENRRNQDRDLPRVDIKRKFKLEFAVEPLFMKKIERLRALLSNKHPKKLDFETLFDIVMDDYLDRHSPEGRIRRREKRKTRAAERSGSSISRSEKIEGQDKSHENLRSQTGKITNSKQSRYIPQSVRDEVYTRDGGRCAYVGTNGKRCVKRKNLQVDHIVPFAKGGKNTKDNLRLLCPRHNMLEAERQLGKEHMMQFRRRE